MLLSTKKGEKEQHQKKIYLIWERPPITSAPCLLHAETGNCMNPLCELQFPRPVCWASTPYFARKECVRRARKALLDLDASLKGGDDPLYKGASPQREGYHLVYTNPGPDASSIDIKYVSRARTGWWPSGAYDYQWIKHHYCVYYATLPQASSAEVNALLQKHVTANETSYIEGIAPATRKNETLHDRFCNEIESRRRRSPAATAPSPPLKIVDYSFSEEDEEAAGVGPGPQ